MRPPTTANARASRQAETRSEIPKGRPGTTTVLATGIAVRRLPASAAAVDHGARKTPVKAGSTAVLMAGRSWYSQGGRGKLYV